MATKLKLFRPRILSIFCTKYTCFKHSSRVLYQSTDSNAQPVNEELPGLTLSDNCVKV